MNYQQKYQKYKEKYLKLKGGNNKCNECLTKYVNNTINDINVSKNYNTKNFMDMDQLIDDELIDDKTLKKNVKSIYGFLNSGYMLYQFNKILHKFSNVDTDAININIVHNDYYENIISLGNYLLEITNNFKTNLSYNEYDFNNTNIYTILSQKLLDKNYKKDNDDYTKFKQSINTLNLLLDELDNKKDYNNLSCKKNRSININEFINSNNTIDNNNINNYCNNESNIMPYHNKYIKKSDYLNIFIKFHGLESSIQNSINDKLDRLIYLSNYFNIFFTGYQEFLIKNRTLVDTQMDLYDKKVIKDSIDAIDELKTNQKYYVQLYDVIKKMENKNIDLKKIGSLILQLHEATKYNFLKSNRSNNTMPFYMVRNINNIYNTKNLVDNFDYNKKKIIINKMFTEQIKSYFKLNDIADLYIVLYLNYLNYHFFRNNYSKNDNLLVNLIEDYVNNNKHIYSSENISLDKSKFKIYDYMVPSHHTLLIKINDKFKYYDSNYLTYPYIFDELKYRLGEANISLASPKLATTNYGIQSKNEGFSQNLENLCYLERSSSPFRGSTGYCASWSQYFKLLTIINFDKIHNIDDIDELVRFMIFNNPFDNKLISDDKIRVYNQRKLFKSKMVELYILYKNDIADYSMLQKILDKKEVDNISKIMTNIDVNLTKYKNTNIYRLLHTYL